MEDMMSLADIEEFLIHWDRGEDEITPSEIMKLQEAKKEIANRRSFDESQKDQGERK